MDYDLFQPIPQGSDGAQDSENKRIEAIADELNRRCKLYEEECRNCKKNATHLEIEQRVTEVFAKENHLWIPLDDIFSLGIPGPSGNENDTYVSNDVIYKVNNLLNTGSILALLDKVMMHNMIFPDTFYQLHAFTGFDGHSIFPVLKQNLIKNAEPAPQISIDTYMAAIGFAKDNDKGCYSNMTFTVWDLIPRNVLRDQDGDLFVVDAEIKKK